MWFNAAFTGFYRTYKELKLSFNFWDKSLATCFYRTYKELKLTAGEFAELNGITVFIVPIRNWNQKQQGTDDTAVSVFIVPIRNWNFSNLFIVLKISETFLSYL